MPDPTVIAKPTPIPPPALTPSMLEKILSNQSEEIGVKGKELDLKKQELDLKKQEDDHSFEYAKEALKAQVGDNVSKRAYFNKKRLQRYIFITIISLIIVALISYALHLNKDQIAMEIIKFIAYTGLGAGGGYYYGSSRQLPRKKNDDSSSAPHSE